MAAKILVVDRNEAFATMLEQMLETEGGYEVQVARTGSDALAILRQTSFDLTIIDMDLDPADLDLAYRQLIPSIRQLEPQMRVMLIPMMGEELPSAAHRLDIQGALSKPFFADDLLPNIRGALTKPLGSPTSQVATPPPSRQQSGQTSSDIQAILSDLARETHAETVLLISTIAREERASAHLSNLDEAKLERLADMSIATIQAAQATAQVLDQPDMPFTHNMFESDFLRVYIMVLPNSMLLAVVTPINTPLGTIRHNLRRAARSIAEADQSQSPWSLT
jgi:CheY-like chemotaxis protein